TFSERCAGLWSALVLSCGSVDLASGSANHWCNGGLQTTSAHSRDQSLSKIAGQQISTSLDGQLVWLAGRLAIERRLCVTLLVSGKPGVCRAVPGLRQFRRLRDSTNHPIKWRAKWTTFRIEKLVILYVFFGVVIIALVIALVYVLVSYRGISRRGRCAGDSSEKAALWRHDDTPLDTFNHNSHASLADVATSPTNTPSNPRDSQVVATVHAESTDEDESRFSTGSGFSSFLPGKDTDFRDLLASLNPYATVGDSNTTTADGRGSGASTLPRRCSGGSLGSNRNSRRSNSLKMNGDLGDIYETIDPPSPARTPSPPLPPPPPAIAMEYMTSDTEPVDHYMVNNDEYALVRKHKNKPALQQVQPGVTASQSGEYTNLPCLIQERNGAGEGGPEPTYDSVEFKVPQDSAPVVNFRPTSGPYDRERNSRGDQNVSPSSGAARHRWDEDL
ncbi:hypothetical protein BaRGS_00009332, partial [Batillaria attramentaria]